MDGSTFLPIFVFLMFIWKVLDRLSARRLAKRWIMKNQEICPAESRVDFPSLLSNKLARIVFARNNEEIEIVIRLQEWWRRDYMIEPIIESITKKN